MSSNRVKDSTIEDLKSISTQALVDSMAKCGYPQGYMEGVRPLQPGYKMVGRAVTLRFVPTRPDLAEDKPIGNDSAEYKAIEMCGPSNILVVDAMGWQYSSIGGDIKFLGLRNNSAGGLVTDGGVRDSRSLMQYGFPIFCASTTAKQGTAELLPWQVNCEVQCAGILVRPGDMVVGDDDGVVVVPGRIALDTATYAKQHEIVEDMVKSQLMIENVSPGKYYPFNDLTWDMYESNTGRKRPEH